MIDCGCKGKTRHYVPLGDEALKICIDCAEKIYKATIEGSIKHVLKGDHTARTDDMKGGS